MGSTRPTAGFRGCLVTPPGRPVPPALAEIRWMIEELRVGFYAQQLRTPYPVSERRILRALEQTSP